MTVSTPTSTHTRGLKILVSSCAAAVACGTLVGCGPDADEGEAASETQAQALEVLVAPNDARIAYDGAMFPTMEGGRMHIKRFNEATLASPEARFDDAKAAMTTGASIRFTAEASSLRAKFRLLAPVDSGRPPPYFSIYRNGAFVTDIKTASSAGPISLTIPTVNSKSLHEIVLPHWANPVFEGLVVNGSCTQNAPQSTKKYIAIGDSITHGTGQSKTRETYPYLLAQRFNWELFNLAVGGSQISPAVGQMIAGRQADFITILIGFNDWNGADSVASFKQRYHTLIGHIRASHPSTPIVCITPTVTTKLESTHKPNVTINDYRNAVRKVVEEEANANVHLAEGAWMTTAADLSDYTHLSAKGAANFAKKLGDTIAPITP